MKKKWLDFGDIDLIFKVTSALWMSNSDQKSVSAPYLLNQMMDSDELYVLYHWDNEKNWIDFGNFQGHHSIKTVKMSLVCTLSPEPIGGFWPNLHKNTSGTWERSGKILVALTSFSRSRQTFVCQILTKKSLSALYLLNRMMDSGQTLCTVSYG